MIYFVSVAAVPFPFRAAFAQCAQKLHALSDIKASMFLINHCNLMIKIALAQLL